MNLKFCTVPFQLLNFHKRILMRQCLMIKKVNFLQDKRHYLSQSYYCQEKWQERFQDPFVKDIKPGDFYYELVRKYKAEKKIFAIDTDIFVNALTETKILEIPEETEEILFLLRGSSETINTLPSTHHTFIRLLLATRQYNLLFKILTDPCSYGIFLDYYVADILMDTFLKENNFSAASRIASMLMLQEDFGPPLTRSFILLSCFKYAFNEKENEPWIDYHIKEEPEEEVKIRVRYLTNPYFDDHFDLREPLHLVGKTLAWLAPHLKEEEETALKLNSEILGWSLYEKWNSLENTLLRLVENKDKLDENIASKITELISKSQDSEVKSRLDNILIKIRDQNLISKLHIFEKVEENCINFVKKFENESKKAQENAYEQWTIKRKEEVEKQLEMFEKNKLLKEIQQKKEDLERREDVIFFFENQDKWELLAPKRKYYPKKMSLIYPKKKKPRVIDSEYIPPEI